MQLKSYVQGRWHAGDRDAQVLRDATTGQVIAEASSSGIDFAGSMEISTGGQACCGGFLLNRSHIRIGTF